MAAAQVIHTGDAEEDGEGRGAHEGHAPLAVPDPRRRRGGRRHRSPRGLTFRSPDRAPRPYGRGARSFCQTARASSATAPSGRARSGLTSSSDSSGWAAATRESAATASAQARRSMGGRPRAPSRSGAPRSERSSSSATPASTGASATATSPERLGEHAPEPDEHERAEARLPAGAGDQLDAVVERRHRLDGERRRGEPRDQVRDRGAESGLVAQPEDDAPGVALVEEPERLEHDREADVPRRGNRLVRVRHGRGAHEGDAARDKQRARRGVIAGGERRRGPRRTMPPVSGAEGAGNAGTPRGGGLDAIRPARRPRARSRRAPARRRRAARAAAR